MAILMWLLAASAATLTASVFLRRRPVHFVRNRDATGPVICSLGADGHVGGVGANADVCSSDVPVAE